MKTYVLAAVLVLSVLGCGDDGDTPSGPTVCINNGDGTLTCLDGDGNRIDSPSADDNSGAGNQTNENPRDSNNPTTVVPAPEPQG